MDKKQDEKIGIWEKVKAYSTMIVVGVIAYKVIVTPINMTVDFPTLLSLLLALFSVALAALFYFKATETSNTFYDNTYNFTKDIAQLLVKMESGFGEKLKNLDEGYTSMRDYIQQGHDVPNQDIEKTKKKIDEEKEEMKKVNIERNNIISNLIEKSTLEREEKDNVVRELKEKEEELKSAQNEMNKMKRRLLIERIERKKAQEHGFNLDSGFVQYTRNDVIRKIGIDRILEKPKDYIKRKFNRLAEDLPGKYIEDMIAEGLFDEGITDKGYYFLEKMAQSYEMKHGHASLF